MLDFPTFCNRLRERLELDGASWDTQLNVVETFDLDSLQMLELAVFMDELGAEVFEEIVPQLQTLGDLYDHYVKRITSEERW